MDRSPRRADPRVEARDAGIRRIYRLTRWLGVGGVGLLGLVAAYVAQAKPGHSTGSGATATAPTRLAAVGGTQTVPPAAQVPSLSTGGEALAPPPEPPAPVTTVPAAPVAPAPVVSGGS